MSHTGVTGGGGSCSSIPSNASVGARIPARVTAAAAGNIPSVDLDGGSRRACQAAAAAAAAVANMVRQQLKGGRQARGKRKGEDTVGDLSSEVATQSDPLASNNLVHPTHYAPTSRSFHTCL